MTTCLSTLLTATSASTVQDLINAVGLYPLQKYTPGDRTEYDDAENQKMRHYRY